MNEWENRYSHLETKVGAGYYALRRNATKPEYSKLVKADRSPPARLRITGKMANVPSIGSRCDRPSTRRARRR